MKIEKCESVIYKVGDIEFLTESEAESFVESYKKITKDRKLYKVAVVTEGTIGLHRFGKTFFASVPSKLHDLNIILQYLYDEYGSPIIQLSHYISIPRYDVTEYGGDKALTGLISEGEDVLFLSETGSVDDKLADIYKNIKAYPLKIDSD